jgi:hypothetical protein
MEPNAIAASRYDGLAIWGEGYCLDRVVMVRWRHLQIDTWYIKESHRRCDQACQSIAAIGE